MAHSMTAVCFSCRLLSGPVPVSCPTRWVLGSLTISCVFGPRLFEKFNGLIHSFIIHSRFILDFMVICYFGCNLTNLCAAPPAPPSHSRCYRADGRALVYSLLFSVSFRDLCRRRLPSDCLSNNAIEPTLRASTSRNPCIRARISLSQKHVRM